MKCRMTILLCALLSAVCFIGCDSKTAETEQNKVSIVTTIYPPADFASHVGGEHVEVIRLLKPGAESHTYEPTPSDIKKIASCDLFIYNGGESDTWIEGILNNIDTESVSFLKMTDAVTMLPEEVTEGMQAEEEDTEDAEEAEMDEHVWTSVENASLITEAIALRLMELDPAHREDYRANADAYEAELAALHQEYLATIRSCPGKEILVGDRFPFRYLAKEYGLTYYAALPGCSEDAEVSAHTLAFLIDKAKAERLPVVFHIEFSNEQVADAIAEASGAKKLLLHSCHNLSAEELEAGCDYLSVMRDNLTNLKEALQ